MNTEHEHYELLARVVEQLAKTPTTTDHLMIGRWRILWVCQCLLGKPSPAKEIACVQALDLFARHGAGSASDKAVHSIWAQLAEERDSSQTVLPTITANKRAEVVKRLKAASEGGLDTIDHAIRRLPSVQERMQVTAGALQLPGVRHRLELVTSVLGDPARTDKERTRAAAAVIYVDTIDDVIPDTLGAIGMLDDDYALRVVLEELGVAHDGSHLHWSETISSMWDDLPFLQGVDLRRGTVPISVTWLDRVNSYVSYSHALRRDPVPLLLVQPSVACSPLHTLVSLMGLMVLDGVTSSLRKARALEQDATYDIDGCVVRFEGIEESSRLSGQLRLRLHRDRFVFLPPESADRMRVVHGKRLSSLRRFLSRPRGTGVEPVQRFFGWDTAIARASISSRTILVTSRQRAYTLLDGVESNGIRLLEHGLVRFVGREGEGLDEYGALVIVAPSLGSARHLFEMGMPIHTILVDGYERLYRGRHEYPFLLNRSDSPAIIGWSPKGYCPTVSPPWMPLHKRLEASSDDLLAMLELDASNTHGAYRSLVIAATGLTVQTRVTAYAPGERGIADAIDGYLQLLRSSHSLPEYWRYHVSGLARSLRTLILSTPAEWSEIKRSTIVWKTFSDNRWASVRGTVPEDLFHCRQAEERIARAVLGVSEQWNSRALSLREFISETSSASEHWYVPCERQEHVRAVASVVKALGLPNVEAILLRDLDVCSNCVVAGWTGVSFLRKLRAHTPETLVVLVDENDLSGWNRYVAESSDVSGISSILGSVDPGRSKAQAMTSKHLGADDGHEYERVALPPVERDDSVACVLLWIAGEAVAKVLPRDGRVIVETGNVVCERVATSLKPDDRVILGVADTRWSPADQFTEALVDVIKKSLPNVAHMARDWRRALHAYQNAQRLPIARVRETLAVVGVGRKLPTLEGWLDLDRASPIAPSRVATDLAALWPLIQKHAQYSLEDVVSACRRLRSLRTAASHVLLQRLKGQLVDPQIDQSRLDDIMAHLRQQVNVCEVEAVTLAHVPRVLLGQWIPPGLAESLESDVSVAELPEEAEGEDELASG